MPRTKKKFIDKKKDIVHSFKVVARSQRDPLIADESAPQSVLLNSNEENETTKEEFGVFFDDDYDYLQHLRGTKEAIDWEDCDLEVYTIRKQDDKASVKGHGKFGLTFPSSAFESYMEEPIGLLNKAAPVSGPQPDVDPDIVAELDRLELDGEVGDEIPDDFFTVMNSEEPIAKKYLDGDNDNRQYSNIECWLDGEEDYDDIPTNEFLDRESKAIIGHGISNCNENFFEELNKEGNYDSDEEYEDIDEEDDEFNVSDDDKEYVDIGYDPLGYGGNAAIGDYEDEKADVLHNLPARKKHVSFDSTSQTSRTSHSCSHLPRPELLTWLDKRCEYVFETEYGKDQIGALDDQEIEGHISVDSEVFKQIMEKTKIQIAKLKWADSDDADKDRIVNWIREGTSLGKTFQKDEYKTVTIPDKEKDSQYNCENILPLRSNISNQPEILDIRNNYSRIVINDKKGYPLFQEKSLLTKKALAQHDQNETGHKNDEFETETLKSRLSLVSYRPPNETAEDRRDRKKAVKELRRDRRIEKKINKEAFKEEKKVQIKTQMNNLHNRKVSIC